MVGVRPAHFGSEVLGLIGHHLALCGIVRILVPVTVAVELAVVVGDGFVRIGCISSRLFAILALAIAIARSFLAAGLQGFVFVLQDGVRTLKLGHRHVERGSGGGFACVQRDLERFPGHSGGRETGSRPNVGQVGRHILHNSIVRVEEGSSNFLS